MADDRNILELPVRRLAARSPRLDAAANAAAAYLDASLSDNTRRAYASRWAMFVRWCELAGESPLPAQGDLVALYLSELASTGLAVATIQQSRAAIVRAHALADAPPPGGPALRQVLRGIGRTHAGAQRQADALTAEQLVRVLPHLGQTRGATELQRLRDVALVLIGWTAALRRSEIAALRVQDMRFDADHGLYLTIPKSKTDQQGHGDLVLVPYASHRDVCALRSVYHWLSVAGVDAGPVFRRLDAKRQGVTDQPLSGDAICDIVAAAARRAGLQGWFTGHSLRAGFVTTAAQRGKRLDLIMRTTRHRRVDMVLRYTRPAELARENAASGLL